MKVLGGEKVADSDGRTGRCRLPEDYYNQAIQYTLALPGLACACIGILNLEQLEQAARAITNLKPLSSEEAHALAVKGLQMAAEEKWKFAYGKPIT